MEIDATLMMPDAFQQCRIRGERGGPAVVALREVLTRARAAGAVWIERREAWGPPGSTPQELELLRGPTRVQLNAENQLLFDVIDRATDELVRLCAAGNRLAAKDLGYALHSLPELLASPTDFDREDYVFCVRFIAFHWSELSEDFKVALCRLLRVDRARGEAIVTKEGFAASMFRTDAVERGTEPPTKSTGPNPPNPARR
jgi:hypothetical protein